MIVVDDMHRARKLPFALKVIDTGKVKGQEDAIENEVAILRRLKNRNIVQLIEEFHTPSATFLVMELITVCIHRCCRTFCMPISLMSMSFTQLFKKEITRTAFLYSRLRGIAYVLGIDRMMVKQVQDSWALAFVCISFFFLCFFLTTCARLS